MSLDALIAGFNLVLSFGGVYYVRRGFRNFAVYLRLSGWAMCSYFWSSWKRELVRVTETCNVGHRLLGRLTTHLAILQSLFFVHSSHLPFIQ